MIHLIVGKRDNAPTVIMPNTKAYIANHKPLRKDYSWWMVDSETGEVIDQYIVKQQVKAKAGTVYAGSWAERMKKHS